MKRWSLLLLLLLASLWLSAPAHADEPVREAKVDPNAYPPSSARLQTVAAGAVMTGVWYGAAVGGSYLFPTAPGAEELRLPVVGPWLSVSQTACPETTPKCNQVLLVVGAVAKVLDGLGQAGGILVMVQGLFLPTLGPEGTSPSARPDRSTWSSLRAAPVVSGAHSNGLGLTLSGSF